MRIPPFCYITDYFQRKSEERKNTLKEEILADLFAKTKPLLEEQGKSVQKDCERLVKEFSKTIKDERKGLEIQVKDLFGEFQDVKSQSKKVSGEAVEVKKNSERMKAVADEAKKEADGAVKGVQIMESAAARANELCDTIEAKLKGYTGLAIDAAVEKCTATVKSEMGAAVKAARDEYKINIDDHKDILERNNLIKMEEHSKKFEGLAQAAIDTFKKECQTALDALKNECRTELEAFKKNYAAAQDDYQKIMPRIDVAAQKFKKLEEQINRLEEAIHDKPQYLVTATLLSSVQRKQLRELYSSEFKGDAGRYKRSLEEWRDRELKGKKSLTPAELEIDFVPKAFKKMMDDIIGHYTRDEVYELLDVVDLLDGIKKNVPANNARPGSGRYNQR